jgi:putative tricarboxylic transport membrane protein
VAYLFATWSLPDLLITDPVGPRVFPYIVGLIGVASAVALGIEHYSRTRKAVTEENFDALPLPDRRTALTILAMLAWTLLFYLVLERIGFVLSCAVYLMGLTSVFNRGHRLVNVAVSVGVAVAIKVVFTRFLGVPLPNGPLPL